MKKESNIPVFEDSDVKRDIEFFPEIGGAYAIRDKAVNHHTDDEGDPWSIIGAKGGHMATFCMRKSKIHLWPFNYTDEPSDVYGDSVPDYVKLARREDGKPSLSNAIRYAWLKWPHARRSGTNCTVVKYRKSGLFYVPYNVDRRIYGSNGSYLIFNAEGIVIGKVEPEIHIDNAGQRLFRGWHKDSEGWYDIIGNKRASNVILEELLEYIEDNLAKKYDITNRANMRLKD